MDVALRGWLVTDRARGARMRNEQGTENPSMSVGAEGLHFQCFREEKKMRNTYLYVFP
jgi:hypothetical protein